MQNRCVVFNQATFYSYDIYGNVDTLLQDYGESWSVANIMNANGNRFKKIVYDYDLISGKVNKVAYQPGWADQFFHKYSYDAENRLTKVETSNDNKTWEQEANYDIPPIRIVEKDGLIYSLDNRRLYVYKEAGVQVPYIKLDKVPADEFSKFTTTNNGTSIQVRKTNN